MIPEAKRAELIYLLVTAAYGCIRFTRDHPFVDPLIEKADGLAKELLLRGPVDLSLTEKGLLWNNSPVSGRASYVLNLSNALRRKGVVKISFTQLLSADYLRAFAASLFEKEPLIENRGIKLEMAQIRTTSPGEAPSAVISSAVKGLLTIFRGITAIGKLNPEEVEHIVSGLISTLREKKRVLRLLSPYTTTAEYIAVHSVNVTLLTLFLADALGISEESIKETGISALLHNVGKLFYSSHAVGRLRNLTVDDWEIISRHPADGALYLSKIHDLPLLAPIVAFEHHMKYNGTGYPDTKRIGKTQHVSSQMVAIADFFESLRMDRPYHRALAPRIIVGLLIERSGSDFNPALVRSFLPAIGKDAGII